MKQGFLYKRLPPKDPKSPGAESDPSLWFHRVNTPQSEDLFVWQDPKSRLRFPGIPRFTPDGRWLVLDVYRSTDPEVTVYVAALGEKGGSDCLDTLEFRQLNEAFDGAYWCELCIGLLCYY
jgi:hypothetical protein